jgi:superfamily II RNA helicase
MQPSTSIFPLDSAVLEDSPNISASSASDTTYAQPDFTSKTSQEIIDLVQQIYGFSPRPYQIRSLHSLQVDRRDTILYAPTGAGKSLITQVYPRPGTMYRVDRQIETPILS